MSSDGKDCGCADPTQCDKKGNSLGVEMVETSYDYNMNMSFGFDYEMETVAAENGCKSGASSKYSNRCN
uniref:Metallothionein-like protein n=1 Tax=Pseudotsuga menziesii var. menziesii TaxID=278161 RepID=Q5MDQ4_PSEMZ|nr:metallothionein-like protein [Pseudotsuga menziesii var. menziesii]AAV92448.1 metallothionein-like protein [Pseudotsuga menziesii var. menziesii]AAV92449.1 metallothionein-like protein [Pseudotsuga menziesii var. menziesii]AAV92452.1 metallothionein-like protein [Pseudotsuga menziesii var. menziesii]AAV92459.1 metallothionein-like protein [Pseudotsuga menziesii var. menziesii]